MRWALIVRCGEEGGHPHLDIKLLILYYKYFTKCKYTPIYSPK